MRLRFVKMNPAENMTVFILDPVPRELQPELAARIMAYGCLHCEQVAFLEDSGPLARKQGVMLRMQMMGGEFCGNAARCFAALMVHKQWQGIVEAGEAWEASFEISGLENIIRCHVVPTEKDYLYLASSAMPLPESLDGVSLKQGSNGWVVRLPGILHVIVPREDHTPTCENFHGILDSLELSGEDAVGVMYHHEREDGTHFIEPLVHIRPTGTLLWERSCGSGSLALGAVLAARQGASLQLSVLQPGGTIVVDINYDNGFRTAAIGGPVTIAAEGFLNL